MDSNVRKEHWDTVYENKNPGEVSWTQGIPKTSLDFIASFGLGKQTRIIDVGGGDSKLVDYLLLHGYENITVLDISARAIEKAQKRLGDKAGKVNWIVSDILDFQPETNYGIWHDRAAFHFLTAPEQILRYVDIAGQAVTGFMTIGTFSENGPSKCSGLEIRQYNQQTCTSLFHHDFEKLRCTEEDNITPSGTLQNFLFCSFKRKYEWETWLNNDEVY